MTCSVMKCSYPPPQALFTNKIKPSICLNKCKMVYVNYDSKKGTAMIFILQHFQSPNWLTNCFSCK